MEQTSLFGTLSSEAAVLKRRHQRKGVEYRVKETAVRPTIDSGALFPSEPQVGAAPSPNSKTKTSVDIDDYDPLATAQAEHDTLLAEVTKRREEASALRHLVNMLEMKREDMEHESEKLAYEDDVEQERERGRKAVEEGKSRTRLLDEQLVESEHYRQTLEYMYKRHKDERVECIALQKAFEQSLSAHTKEFELKQKLLTDVRLSKDEETAALQALQKDIAQQIADLDKKIEAKKVEIRLHQEKARLRATQLEHDLLLQNSQLLIGPREEKILTEKVKELAQQAANVRAERSKAFADADAAESLYNELRFAAGLPALKSPKISSDDAEATFTPPEAGDIITRYTKLDSELEQMDNEIVDYSTRLKALRQRHATLLVAKQPKARDAKDELDTDISRMNAFARRQETARRAVEAAKAELAEASGVKIQIQQTVDLLTRRVDGVPMPPAELQEPTPSLDLDLLASINRLLDKDEATLPTEWSRNVHQRLRASVDRLREILRLLHPDEASEALSIAASYVEAHATTARRSHARSLTRTSSVELPAFRASPLHLVEQRRASLAPLPPLAFDVQATGKLALIGNESEVEATIDTLVRSNPYTVRVPAASGEADGHTSKTAKVISEAINTFERQLREGIAQNLKETLPPSSPGESRHSRARYAKDKDTENTGESEGPQFLRRVSVVGQATASLKPKARELQKMLAAAMQMSGAEVDETLAGQAKEIEDVLSRDAIKRATMTQLRQAAKTRQKALAAAAKEAKSS